jgi:hypothetical protein
MLVKKIAGGICLFVAAMAAVVVVAAIRQGLPPDIDPNAEVSYRIGQFMVPVGLLILGVWLLTSDKKPA